MGRPEPIPGGYAAYSRVVYAQAVPSVAATGTGVISAWGWWNELTWSHGISGAGTSAAWGARGRSLGARLQCGATSGNAIFAGPTSGSGSAGRWDQHTISPGIVKYATLAALDLVASSSGYIWWAADPSPASGILDVAPGSLTTPGAYFYPPDNGAAGTWKFRVCDGTVGSEIDTGIAVSTDPLWFEIIPSTTALTWSIRTSDGELLATGSTSTRIPTGSTNIMPWVGVRKNATNAGNPACWYACMRAVSVHGI